jgi:hypothetical protein
MIGQSKRIKNRLNLMPLPVFPVKNRCKKVALAARRSDLMPNQPPPVRKNRKQLRGEAVGRLFK